MIFSIKSSSLECVDIVKVKTGNMRFHHDLNFSTHFILKEFLV